MDIGARPASERPLAAVFAWLARYRSAVYRGDGGVYDAVALIGPDYTPSDNGARDAGLEFSQDALWGQLAHVSFEQVDHSALPVVFIHGRHDTNVSAPLLGEWYARLHAPSKKLVWFDDVSTWWRKRRRAGRWSGWSRTCCR